MPSNRTSGEPRRRARARQSSTSVPMSVSKMSRVERDEGDGRDETELESFIPFTPLFSVRAPSLCAVGQVPVSDVPVVELVGADGQVFLAEALRVGDLLADLDEGDDDAVGDEDVVHLDDEGGDGLGVRLGLEAIVAGVVLRVLITLEVAAGPAVRLLSDVLGVGAGVPTDKVGNGWWRADR